MNKNLTEIVSIIDRSGSMQRIKQDAIGGFNSFVEEQLDVEGKAQITVVLFNHEYHKLVDGVPLTKDVQLNNENYVTAGTTALLDAVGRTIDDVGVRLHNTPEHERPSLIIVAILTDGLENASKDYSRQRIFDMITHQQNQYNWHFMFLAANQDAIAAARSINIQAANAVQFDHSSEGIRQAYRTHSKMARQARRALTENKELKNK